MSRRPRAPRRRKCQNEDGSPKKPLTREHADRTLARRIAAGASADTLRVYECPICKGWHVGHHATNARRSR